MYGPYFRITKYNFDNSKEWWNSFYYGPDRLKHIHGDPESVDEQTWQKMKNLSGWDELAPPLEFESFYLEQEPKGDDENEDN